MKRLLILLCLGVFKLSAFTRVTEPLYITEYDFDTSSNYNDHLLNGFMYAGLIDFSNSGYPGIIAFDLAPPNGPQKIQLYKNSNGTFQNVTDEDLGDVRVFCPRNIYVGDLTGDGLQDVFIACTGDDSPPFAGEQSRLLVQTPSGKLVDETTTRLPLQLAYTHSVSVADINGDGYPDIYMSNTGPSPVKSQFYINDGSGHFTPSYGRIPEDIVNNGRYASLLVDINEDGYPDLVLGSNDNNSVNEILINNSKGYFYRDSKYTLPPKLLENTSTVIQIVSADLNGDGIPDLLLSTTGGFIITPSGNICNGYQTAGIQVLLSKPDGTYYDATSKSGIMFDSNEQWVSNIRIADINHDGILDIIATVKPNHVRVFYGKGDGTFVDSSTNYNSLTIPNNSNSDYLVGDLNKDGVTDIVQVSDKGITAQLSRVLNRKILPKIKSLDTDRNNFYLELPLSESIK
jgi:FG-GAP-like repeat